MFSFYLWLEILACLHSGVLFFWVIKYALLREII